MTCQNNILNLVTVSTLTIPPHVSLKISVFIFSGLSIESMSLTCVSGVSLELMIIDIYFHRHIHTTTLDRIRAYFTLECCQYSLISKTLETLLVYQCFVVHLFLFCSIVVQILF